MEFWRGTGRERSIGGYFPAIFKLNNRLSGTVGFKELWVQLGAIPQERITINQNYVGSL